MIKKLKHLIMCHINKNENSIINLLGVIIAHFIVVVTTTKNVLYWTLYDDEGY